MIGQEQARDLSWANHRPPQQFSLEKNCCLIGMGSYDVSLRLLMAVRPPPGKNWLRMKLAQG